MRNLEKITVASEIQLVPYIRTLNKGVLGELQRTIMKFSLKKTLLMRFGISRI